jgi:hypothetical protein
MASGVFRPYTVQDIIGSLSDSVGSLSADSTSTGTGFFLEADEVVGLTDTATVTTQANPPWGEGQWGQIVWS